MKIHVIALPLKKPPQGGWRLHRLGAQFVANALI